MQELRKHKHRPTKIEEVNPFSGVCFCADCGKKMYLCRSKSLTSDQEHLKCGTYANEKDECSAHFIRTIVLKEIILGELNKMISFVKENEDDFVQAAMDNSIQKQSSELTPEIMHELTEKIIVHAPDKSSGHRTQEIEIHHRFNVAVTTAIDDSMK